MNAATKKLILKYAYFSIIMFSLFLILALCTVLTRKSWTVGLRTQIQTTLDAMYPESNMIVADAIQIEQPAAVSAAAYTVQEDGKEDGYAVILRMTGIAGPAAAIYLERPGTSELSFVAITNDSTLYDSSYPWYGVMFRQIKYWKEMIPSMTGRGQ